MIVGLLPTSRSSALSSRRVTIEALFEEILMSFWLRLCLGLAILAPSLTQAAVLEIPGDGDKLSGIGVISGWKCEADGDITARFDGGPPLQMVYESDREDTRGACGDANNGFLSIFSRSLTGRSSAMGNTQHGSTIMVWSLPRARSRWRPSERSFWPGRMSESGCRISRRVVRQHGLSGMRGLKICISTKLLRLGMYAT